MFTLMGGADGSGTSTASTEYGWLVGGTDGDSLEVWDEGAARVGGSLRAAWMGGGRACKVKTQWWLEAGQQQQHRWYSQGAVRAQSAVRRHKRELHLESEWRPSSRGWWSKDCRVSPVRAL